MCMIDMRTSCSLHTTTKRGDQIRIWLQHSLKLPPRQHKCHGGRTWCFRGIAGVLRISGLLSGSPGPAVFCEGESDAREVIAAGLPWTWPKGSTKQASTSPQKTIKRACPRKAIVAAIHH
jgi:hypothetical protein